MGAGGSRGGAGGVASMLAALLGTRCLSASPSLGVEVRTGELPLAALLFAPAASGEKPGLAPPLAPPFVAPAPPPTGASGVLLRKAPPPVPFLYLAAPVIEGEVNMGLWWLIPVLAAGMAAGGLGRCGVDWWCLRSLASPASVAPRKRRLVCLSLARAWSSLQNN